MKTLKHITNFLCIIVYVCIIGFLAIAAPLALGYHPVVVLSGSMEPTYHVGSVIYYKAAPFEQINVGDPITFVGAEGGAMVTHRVVEKDETARAFGTEGDANDGRDPGMVPYSNVVDQYPIWGIFCKLWKTAFCHSDHGNHSSGGNRGRSFGKRREKGQ